jgi:hypothetical protein
MITGWRGSNSFQIYVNRSENLYVHQNFMANIVQLIIKKINVSSLSVNKLCS